MNFKKGPLADQIVRLIRFELTDMPEARHFLEHGAYPPAEAHDDGIVVELAELRRQLDIANAFLLAMLKAMRHMAEELDDAVP